MTVEAIAAGAAGTVGRRRRPVGMLVGAAISIQCSAALALSLFGRLGIAGVVELRLLLGGLILAVVGRSRLRRLTRDDLRTVALFGLAVCGLNTLYYVTIRHAPLGVVVAIELLGPLALAVWSSRDRHDAVWVALAAAGVALFAGAAEGGASGVTVLGLCLALASGGCWAWYIVVAGRVARRLGDSAAALAPGMLLGAAVVLPFAILDAGERLMQPKLAMLGLAVAIFGSALPFFLELEAYKQLPVHIAATLTALEPAVAAIVGVVLVGQQLELRLWVAIGLVVAAAAGVVHRPEAAAVLGEGG